MPDRGGGGGEAFRERGARRRRDEERGGGGGVVSILASGIRTEDAPGDLVANARRRDAAAAAALAASRAKKPKASKASKAKGGKAGKGAPGGSASSNLPTLVSKFPADPDAHGGFDRDAPDGIYRLDLANPIDRDVATRVFLLDVNGVRCFIADDQSRAAATTRDVALNGAALEDDPIAPAAGDDARARRPRAHRHERTRRVPRRGGGGRRGRGRGRGDGGAFAADASFRKLLALIRAPPRRPRSGFAGWRWRAPRGPPPGLTRGRRR